MLQASGLVQIDILKIPLKEGFQGQKNITNLVQWLNKSAHCLHFLKKAEHSGGSNEHHRNVKFMACSKFPVMPVATSGS